ncbi:MOSC domain-containing protein [Verrucomicrobium sp. BvORR034]|uniref:MOSC domain-containing protein n=1 Tax=Verrucomicrobium sp. BvORR034 TaxID=1396418 RepID=UPI0031B57380
MGLKGDRYFGYRPSYKGQVTFFDLKTLQEIGDLFKLPKLPASVFRRNLIVEGLDLRACLGRRFIFQGVLFEGSQECKPCHWMDRAVAPGTETFMKAQFRGGLRAKILENGVLHVVPLCA